MDSIFGNLITDCPYFTATLLPSVSVLVAGGTDFPLPAN